jgi:hypothetical protein
MVKLFITVALSLYWFPNTKTNYQQQKGYVAFFHLVNTARQYYSNVSVYSIAC